MALVRILIDGYNLLHAWERYDGFRENHSCSLPNGGELAPGKARHSAAARDELVRVLTLYQDAVGTPVTIFFDGSRPRSTGPSDTSSTPEVEILFSHAGQTADQMIERAAHRFQPFGEVLVVTD